MKRITFLLLSMAMMVLLPNTAMAQSQPQATRIVTNHADFRIKIQRCVANGTNVLIDMLFINEGTKDVDNISIHCSNWHGVEAYDSEGNIYREPKISVKVANGEEYRNSSKEFSILTGVPMRVSLLIKDVSETSESIARLKLCVDCSEWALDRSKPIVFRNIPISRD